MGKLDEFRAAGFTDQEINDWAAEKTRTWLSAGFSQEEVKQYLGVPPELDLSGFKKQFQQNIDNHIKANTKEDGTRPAMSLTDALEAGFQMSVTGLASRRQMPNLTLPEDASMMQRISYQTAVLAGDAPAMLAGWLGGAAAGGVLGSEAPVVGNITAAAAGGMAGSFAVPAGLRQAMVEAYTKGSVKNFADFWDRASATAIATGKGAITGLATAGAGGVAGKVLAPVAAPAAVKTVAQMGTEIGTMVTVGKALEGEMPTASDFQDAAVLLLGAKGVGKVGGKIMNVYAKTGVKPEQMVTDAKADPTIAQDLASGREIPRAYEDQIDPMFKKEEAPAPEAGGMEPPTTPPETPVAPEPGTPEAARQTILDQIQVGGEVTKAPMTLDKLYTKYLDDLAPINKAVEAISKGGEVPAEQNPYVQARLVRGVYGKAQQFLENSPFNFKTLANEGESLKSIVDPVRDDLDGLRAYAAANRAIELDARGIKSGLDVEAARQVVADGGKYAPVLTKMIDYQNRLTAYLRDAGVLSKDAYGAMVDANKNYVPFYRVFEDSDAGGVGTGLKTRNPIKAIKGSERAIVDPIESIVKNTYAYITLAERNGVAKSFYDLAKKAEDPSQFFEEVPAGLRATEVTDPEMQRFLKANGIDKMPEDALTVFRAARQPLAKDEIGFFDEGKYKVLKVDPDLAEAFNATDRQTVGLLTKFLSYPAKALRMGSTLSPDFMVRNFFRDQVTAFAFSKEGFVPILDTLKGASSLIAKDADYQNWLKSGGANSAMVSLDRRYIQSELFKIIGENPDANFVQKAWNVATKPVEWLRITSELVENATRLGEFKKSLGEGLSKEDILNAGYDSREITLDFARVGTNVRAMNMITAFFNAQVQGVDRAVRAVKENPLGTMARIGAGITLPSVLLWAANHDDPRYKELPGWQRDLFWIVMTKDHIYRIPKPFELGIVFGSGVERMLDALSGQMDKKDLTEFLATTGGGILPNFMPTAVSPVLEQLTNHSFFSGHTLVPGSLEKMLPEYQYTEYTSEMTKAIGHIVGTVPAIKDTRMASPVVIDNYLRAWTGGLGTYALQLADAGLRKAGVLPDPVKPAATLADIPVVKAFVVRYPAATAESLQRFHEDYNKAQVTYNTMHQLFKQGDFESGAKVQATTMGMAKMDSIDKALQQENQLIRLVYRNPAIDPDQKRQIIDATYYQMIEQAKMGNAFMKEFARVTAPK